jgi:hypothetical protein
MTFPGDSLDEAFISELVERVLLPILNSPTQKDPS